MASDIAGIRDLCQAAILAKKVALQFIFNDFDLITAYVPVTALKNMPVAGEVYLVGLTGMDGPKVSRTNAAVRESPVQVGYRKVVDPDDVPAIDRLIEFYEQLKDTMRKNVDQDHAYWSWSRNEPLLDENKTPFAFVGLREANLFEAYFTTYFTRVLS